jgi:hypothetical protein
MLGLFLIGENKILKKETSLVFQNILILGPNGSQKIREPPGLIHVFARGPHCLWCRNSRWSPPLDASITLKNEQK